MLMGDYHNRFGWYRIGASLLLIGGLATLAYCGSHAEVKNSRGERHIEYALTMDDAFSRGNMTAEQKWRTAYKHDTMLQGH